MGSGRRRTDGDETWIRLQAWIKGQKPAERLAAHILAAEGYKSIDPSHPLGGRDGLKDLICKKDYKKWVVACYFPREPKAIREIKSKFVDDFRGVEENDSQGFIFITNQELTLGERKILNEVTGICDTEIYHLERISHVLNRPENYGVRLEFLDIEITSEEQVSYFASHQNQLKLLTDKIEIIMNDYSDFKKSDENNDNRDEDEIGNAIEELFDKIWYDRHQGLRYKVLELGKHVDEDIWAGALDAARKIEEKYGEENLGPWTDFEWGMMNGKISALRWFFGDDWDMLDT
jgi:hypothetical protein